MGRGEGASLWDSDPGVEFGLRNLPSSVLGLCFKGLATLFDYMGLEVWTKPASSGGAGGMMGSLGCGARSGIAGTFDRCEALRAWMISLGSKAKGGFSVSACRGLGV